MEQAKRWRFCCPWKGSGVAIRTPARKSSPCSSSQFSCAVPDLPGTRSTQAGRGVILPACQVHDAGELTGAPAASVLVVPYVLVNPQHPHACEAGGVIRCGLQARFDIGPHGVPRGCELSGQSCNGGSLEAQLSDRPADRPHTQTRPGSTHRVVLLNESHDPAGVFAAYPASLKPPEPCRDPGPGRVDHLHDHATAALCDSAHNPGSQPAGCTTQHRVPEHLGCEPRSSDGSPPNRRADHTDYNDQATRNSSRERETPPEVLEDSGGRSPLIIKDLYPQPPTNTQSPTLNSEEPVNRGRRAPYQCQYTSASPKDASPLTSSVP